MVHVHCLKMDPEAKYTFVEVPENDSTKIGDKSTEELFAKWGLNLHIQEYFFNELLHQYHKYQLAEAFFKDKTVQNSLKIYKGRSWTPAGLAASSVEVKQLPCSVVNMTFFDKLKNPENNIIYHSGTICKRFDFDIDGFLVGDNLRGMLLDDESSEYHLYEAGEREEFIFKIFQMLVLGGEVCQYEDALEPYLTCTKNLYKNLIRVQKPENSQILSVSSMVFQVVAKDDKDTAYFPCNPEHKQNMAFLLIDSDLRRVRVVSHQFSGYFE